MAGIAVPVGELEATAPIPAVGQLELVVDESIPSGAPGVTWIGRHSDGCGIGEHVNGARDTEVPREPDRELAEAEQYQEQKGEHKRELDERLSGASRFARRGL
jgi:hypothetical protein